MDNPIYTAFISYRHVELDKQVAKKLHYLLEHYCIPKELQDEHGNPDTNNGILASRRLGRVFRDEEELPASANLSDSIHTAIDHSEFLIVVCSPKTKESIWVRQEIEYFLKGHERSHLIAVLVEGTPEESFPDLLTTDYAEDGVTVLRITEPLAANLTDTEHHYDHRRLQKEIFRIYAAIIGCSFDSLWQREKRYQQHRLMRVLLVTAVALLGFSTFVMMKNRQIQKQNDEIQRQNAEIKEQNDRIIEQSDKIVEQNDEISNQKKEIEKQLSETQKANALVNIRNGSIQLKNGNAYQAIDCALNAIQTPEGMQECSSEAYFLLYDALGAGQKSLAMRTVTSIEQEKEINEIKVSHDGEKVFSIDELGCVRCYSIRDGELLWVRRMTFAFMHDYHYNMVQRSRLFEVEKYNMLLCCYENRIFALSLTTGETLWNYDIEKISYGYTDFCCVSEDLEKIVFMEGYNSEEKEERFYRLVSLRMEDGQVQQSVQITDNTYGMYDSSDPRSVGVKSGVFSDDGRYLMGGIFLDESYQKCSNLRVFLWDMETNEIVDLCYVDGSFGYNAYVAGYTLNVAEGNCLFCYYDEELEKLHMVNVLWDGTIAKDDDSVMVKRRSRTNREDPMHVSYNEEGNFVITVTCGEQYIIYSKKDGAYILDEDLGDSDILRFDWFCPDRVQEDTSFCCLLDNGEYYCYYAGDGFLGHGIHTFSEKSSIALMDITESFFTGTARDGFQLEENVTEAVVYDQDRTKISILKSGRDTNIENVEWGTGTASTKRLIRVEDDLWVLCAQVQDSDAYRIKVIQPSANKVIHEYTIPNDILKNYTYNTLYNVIFNWYSDIQFWPDGRHFTCFWDNYIVTYDMENGRLEEAFPIKESSNWKKYDGVAEKLADGQVLQAEIMGKNAMYGNKDGEFHDYHYETVYELQWRLGDGKIHSVNCPTRMAWRLQKEWALSSGCIKLGANGMILIGQYKVIPSSGYIYSTEDLTDSFYLYDTLQEKEYVIRDECPADSNRIVAMANKEKLFATADEDGFLRIYDVASQSVMHRIAKEDPDIRIYSMAFSEDDRLLAVFMRDFIMLYDVQSAECVASYSLDTDWETSYNNDFWSGELRVLKDEENHRYFVIVDNRYQAKIACLDDGSYKVLFDIGSYGDAQYCKETNDIYAFGGSFGGSYCINTIPAYTLTDLVEWANRE